MLPRTQDTGDAPRAVIDLGTHTARLLVARMEGTRLIEVAGGTRFTRLGEGLDTTGKLSEHTKSLTSRAVMDLIGVARDSGCSKVELIATSACRRALNGQTFIAALERELGIRCHLIAGEVEAALAFEAVRGEFPGVEKLAAVDIGGGSTEIAWSASGPMTPQARSLNVGSVVTRRSHFDTFPPSSSAVTNFRAEVKRALASAPIGALREGTLCVALAGTAKCLAALDANFLRLEDVPSGAQLTADAVANWAERLSHLSLEATLALSPLVLENRTQLIAAGSMILAETMAALNVSSVKVGLWGIRHGWLLQRYGADSC